MVRPECQAILDEIFKLKAEIVDFQEQLHDADTYQQRERAATEIRNRWDQINKKLQPQFDECEGRPPLPEPIGTQFPSTVRISTNNTKFSMLGPAPAAAGMNFSGADYKDVVFAFPDTIIGTFTLSVLGVPVITNNLSAGLTKPASGSFERSTGHIDIPSAIFQVSHSAGLIGSTVEFKPLTTRTVPSSLAIEGILLGLPLDRGASPGRVVLVGSSTLVGGNYGGTVVDMRIAGTLTRFPPP